MNNYNNELFAAFHDKFVNLNCLGNRLPKLLSGLSENATSDQTRPQGLKSDVVDQAWKSMCVQ